MTDGILLAEMQRDRMLRKYDTIIIDEAHERSLNIDFILGYLKQLLPRRPDLKVIITSATIDPERFAAALRDADGEPAPIIEVSGPHLSRRGALPAHSSTRTAPTTTERDQVTGVCEAVEELWTERTPRRADILVFLSGEREIRDTADALDRHERCRRPRCCRSTRGSRRPSSTGCSAGPPGGASCWPPTSPRRR